jgi:predicted NUDIX family phosphoesterase/thymidylate kinase
MKDNDLNNKNIREEKIKYYEKLANDIRLNLFTRKRPLIIEFTGSPKSGKTTAINSLSLFFRRNNIPLYVITERASICPIPNKKFPEFNIWTGCTSLAELLRCKYDKTNSVIILDRGIFDSLIWMNLSLENGKLKKDELCKIEEFFLLKKWLKEIDLVIYMYSTAEKALEREYKDLLTDKPGSIMNKTYLNKFLEIAKKCIKKYHDNFNKIISIDTTDTKTIEGVDKVTSVVIESLKELSDDTLVVIPKAKFLERLNIAGFIKEKNKYKTLERLLKVYSTTQRRSIVEEDTQKLQIVVCSVIKYKNRIALFEKNEIRGDKRLHKKNMIWLGGHLHRSDIESEDKFTLRKSLINCLNREIEEEIQISTNLNPIFKGLVYDKTHSKSLLHLGIVFQIELKDLDIFRSINLQTFFELSGQSNFVEFFPLEKTIFVERIDKLEPWSIDILKQLFDIDLSEVRKSNQTILF